MLKKYLSLLTLFGVGLLVTLKTQAAIIAPPDGDDTDEDTITDDVDLCLDSTYDATPNPQHYGWLGGNYFKTTNPKTKALEDSNYSITDTKGCTCAQILEQKPGENNGEQSYSCTKGTIENFIKDNN